MASAKPKATAYLALLFIMIGVFLYNLVGYFSADSGSPFGMFLGGLVTVLGIAFRKRLQAGADTLLSRCGSNSLSIFVLMVLMALLLVLMNALFPSVVFHSVLLAQRHVSAGDDMFVLSLLSALLAVTVVVMLFTLWIRNSNGGAVCKWMPFAVLLLLVWLNLGYWSVASLFADSSCLKCESFNRTLYFWIDPVTLQ